MVEQAWLQYGSFGLLAAGLVYFARIFTSLSNRALNSFDNLSSAVTLLSHSIDGNEARAEKRHGEVMAALAASTSLFRLQEEDRRRAIDRTRITP